MVGWAESTRPRACGSSASTRLRSSPRASELHREHDDAMPWWPPDGRSLQSLSGRAGNRDIWSVALGPNKTSQGGPRRVQLFETMRFSSATQSYQGFDDAAGIERTYFRLRKLTGRIHLLSPKAAALNPTP